MLRLKVSGVPELEIEVVCEGAFPVGDVIVAMTLVVDVVPEAGALMIVAPSEYT